MLKLELDWASDHSVEKREYIAGWDDEHVSFEFDDRPGPSGWPTVRVYVRREVGEPNFMAYQRLDAWLRDVYGVDEAGAEELSGGVEEV